MDHHFNAFDLSFYFVLDFFQELCSFLRRWCVFIDELMYVVLVFFEDGLDLSYLMEFFLATGDTTGGDRSILSSAASDDKRQCRIL